MLDCERGSCGESTQTSSGCLIEPTDGFSIRENVQLLVSHVVTTRDVFCRLLSSEFLVCLHSFDFSFGKDRQQHADVLLLLHSCLNLKHRFRGENLNRTFKTQVLVFRFSGS